MAGLSTTLVASPMLTLLQALLFAHRMNMSHGAFPRAPVSANWQSLVAIVRFVDGPGNFRNHHVSHLELALFVHGNRRGGSIGDSGSTQLLAARAIGVACSPAAVSVLSTSLAADNGRWSSTLYSAQALSIDLRMRLRLDARTLPAPS